MTSMYGSKRQPRRVFGEGEGLEAFYQTMQEELPGAWALNEALRELWQPNALSHDWVLPDNFHVHVNVMSPVAHPIVVNGQKMSVTTYENLGTETGLSLGANVVHSIDGLVVREMARRCSYDAEKVGYLREILDEIDRTGTYSTSGELSRNHDLVETLWKHYRETGFLSARILEVLDTENLALVLNDLPAIQSLLDTLPAKPFPVLAIHDAFACHPNYGNDVRRQYNRILHDIGASEMLASVVSDIAGQPTQVHKYGGNLATHVLESNYSLS